ncbi:MAG: c-type cytochrome [Nitrospirota bacterium]|nr:c-type cytochrome [Nitrospirota bacterium]
MRAAISIGCGLLLAALWAVPPMVANAAGDAAGSALLAEQCAGCHNLTGPAPDTVQAVRARKGPDLFYAGDKYRAEWLTEWLQKPTRIRPGGAFYGDHIVPSQATDKWDQIDTASLPDHPALSAPDARAVSAALMANTPYAERIATVTVEPVSLPIFMGDMLFDKFKGCIACHQSGKDYGGFSGPELYTAADRLNPRFIYSYMQNPQAWDPKIWMPNMNLAAADLNKLVRYLQMIAEEE